MVVKHRLPGKDALLISENEQGYLLEYSSFSAHCTIVVTFTSVFLSEATNLVMLPDCAVNFDIFIGTENSSIFWSRTRTVGFVCHNVFIVVE